MRELVVASRNKGKVMEIRNALAQLPIEVLSLEQFGDIGEPAETGKTFEENAIIKAKYYAKITGKACLADDSGLQVDALDGAPGVYSARYAGENASDAANNYKLLSSLHGVDTDKRTAKFCCVMALIDTDENIITAEGTCEGIILDSLQGNDGFGYDPLFFVPPKDCTMAQMSIVEKNKISHRGQALKIMTEKLKGYIK